MAITMTTKKMMTMTSNGWKHCWVQSSRSEALATRNASTATGHRSSLCCYKKKKGGSEKASAAAETSGKKTRSKCSHCSGTSHCESNCWKKSLHKAPSKSCTESSGAVLEEELLVCNTEVNDTNYVTENIENT
jgi:hypothetical protein